MPGEGSVGSPAVLLATHVPCRPRSLQVVSRMDRPGECLLGAELFGWALCLFEEDSQLLSYWESFAGVLIITLGDSEHQQRTCYIFPTVKPKASRQARQWFLLLSGRSRTERGLQELRRT